MQLEGLTVLVTGANRGIGAAFAAALADAGAAKVYAGARDPASVTDPRVVPVRLDVTDAAGVRALAEELGDVQLVVNNAGVGAPSAPLDIDVETARWEFDVNYFGTLAVSQAFAPVLARNGGGTLVNMLSVVSWIAMPHLANYSATKAAAWSLTNGLRVQLREQGTRVVGVHVGYVETDLTEGLQGDKIQASEVADALIAGLRADDDEVLVDEISRQVKAGLSNPPSVLYGEASAA
ncbi:SDR family oxidoreductase [Patulibacter minatonensis]|uniref:SDR family oxidoreductase n=1 Tax=Patulibacter minatonensis TaxID=298163 RepID=UPI00047DC6BC|nr:SDR family oxidoreductase [Patulibacter minatonensis]